DPLVTGVQTCALPIFVEELRYFTAASGRTIVDVTPTNLGRSPLDLRRISQLAGVQILMGGGYYLAATQPHAALEASAEDLADGRSEERRVGKGCRVRQ